MGHLVRSSVTCLLVGFALLMNGGCAPTPEDAERTRKVEERLAAKKKEREDAAAARKAQVPDAAGRQKILATLKASKDDFQKATFYQHPRTPVLGSQVYLYIAESDDHYTLRLVATYEGEDWIFWDKLLFKVGEQVITLDAGRFNVKRDNSSGKVWETVDLPVIAGTVGHEKLNFTETTALVFAALAKAEAASMRFQGEHVSDRQIPKAELARFQEVGKRFMALFGVVD